MSTPNKSLCDLSKFEDFGDAINEGENDRYVTDDSEGYTEHHSGCARPESSTLATSHKNLEASVCGVVCDYVKTASVGEVHESLFVKPQSMRSGKFHNKLQAVVSPTYNLKLCQTVRNDEGSRFKIPAKAVPHATCIPKPNPVRRDKKCSFKPTATVKHSKILSNYKKIVSPVGAYIHNIPSPSLVTTVKPNLAPGGTPKKIMVGRDAAVTSRHATTSRIEKVCLKVSFSLLLVADLICVCVCVCVCARARMHVQAENNQRYEILPFFCRCVCGKHICQSNV
jgi:hypothetical protein